MLRVKYNIIDGCEWTRSDDVYEKIFKDDDDLNKYIESMWSSMYEIHIINKEYMED